MNQLAMLARKIRLSLGLAIIKLSDDAKKIQQVQLTAFKDEVRSQVNRYQEYGFTANPKADAQAVIAAIGGNRSHLIVLCVEDGRYRKKDLDEGEVAMYHWEGGYLHFKNGKEVHLTMAEGKVFVDCPEVTVTASTKVTLDSPSVECKHDLKVSGKLDVTNEATFGSTIDASGAITGDTVKDAAGIVLGTHIHTSATPGSPTSAPL